MAQRRMFSPDIVGSDAFLDMPTSSQCLYFHLGMYADDDGFVNPKRIMRMAGVSDDDLKILITKRFVLPFENGVVVIKHWRINNLIRKDWYKETQYLDQKKLLTVKENQAYTELVNESLTNRQHRLGKVSIVKNSLVIDSKHFVPPSLEELKTYISENNYQVNAEQWLDHYQSNGWKVGRNPMKDWRAAVRTWVKRSGGFNQPKTIISI